MTSQLYDHLDAPMMMNSDNFQEDYSKLYSNGQDCVVWNTIAFINFAIKKYLTDLLDEFSVFTVYEL